MKLKIFYVLFSFFLMAWTPFYTLGNTNTREYCESLMDSSTKEWMNKNHTKSLEYLINAKTLAENNNWKDLQTRTLNSIGRIYSDVLEYDKSMEYYAQGYKIALEEGDTDRKLSLLNNIGVLYSSKKDYKQSKEYIQRAYDLANELNDTLKIGRLATNLAVIAHKMDDYEQAEKYINISFDILENHTQRIEFLFAQIAKTENLYLRRNYDEAETLALKVLDKEVFIFDENLKNQFYVILSKIYYGKQNLSQAIYYAQKALYNDAKLTDKIDIYQELSNIYQEKKEFIRALQYKDSVIILKDSLHFINEMDKEINNQIRFDLIHLENKLSVNEAKQKLERRLYISIIAFFIILIIVLIWVFRIQSMRNKQRKQITELELEQEKNQKLIMEQQFKEKETLALLEQEQLNNENLRLEQQLTEQETLALLEQERLNNEIDAKNRQLTAQILSQSNKNRLIEEILETLPTSASKVDADTLSSIRRKLKMDLKESSELSSFLVHFEQINPMLFSVLNERHQNLTTGDILLLSYIYLHLNTKEIASLLNITPDYCKKKKQRLANKMGLKVSELYDYLINIT